MILINSVMRI